MNNAGTILRSPAVEHSDEYWDQVIETDLNAQFILSREIGKRMVERGSGKIIFTASLLTFQGGITVPGYAAAKGAIGQLTKALANEWAAKGVQVNAIAPGYITTDNTAALRADPGRNTAILARIPAGRWGDAGRFQRRRRIPGVARFRLREWVDSRRGWRLDGQIAATRVTICVSPSGPCSSSRRRCPW